MDPQQQLITTWALVVIAVAAFFTSLYQVRATRKHNQLSVTPNLNFSYSDNDGLFIENKGIGPAIIQSFKCTINNFVIFDSDTEKDNTPMKANLKVAGSKVSICVINNGYSLKHGEAFGIIQFDKIVDNKRAKAYKEQIDKFIEHVILEIKYKSIYDKKYSVDFSQDFL